MRFRNRVLLAVGCISLMAMNTPAFGNPASCDAEQTPRAARQSYTERVAAASKPIFGWPELVKEARKYLRTNPTDRNRLWCATFMNFILANLGYPDTNSDAAKSFAYYGRRISKPEVGAIAVLTRGKRGGHVGVVSGVDANGNSVIISGNNKRVGLAVYPRSRVIAYVMPTSRGSPGPAARQAASTRTGAGRTTAGASADNAITSPIAELLAVINAEGTRAEAPRRRPVRCRIVQQLPQQRADTGGSPLAEVFGVRDRAQSPQQPAQRAQVRQRRVDRTRTDRGRLRSRPCRPARSAEPAVRVCHAVRSTAGDDAGGFVTAW